MYYLKGKPLLHEYKMVKNDNNNKIEKKEKYSYID